MEWLKIIGRYHNEWLSIIRSFGEYDYAEDIVQETYIRLYNANAGNKVLIGDEVNKAFMYVTLRNNYISFAKEKSKVYKVELKYVKPIVEDDNLDMYLANDILEKKALDEMENWHWYNRQLFLHYIDSGKSMRTIAKESKISLSSIANTLKTSKEKLQNAISEDWQDYRNKDYRFIMAKKKKNKKKKMNGLGDVVEATLEATGIAAAVKWLVGEDCGCEARKNQLNQIFPFRDPKCLNEDEHIWLSDWYSTNDARMNNQQQRRFIEIYNRVFNKKTTVSSCGKCVATKLREMKRIYDAYE